MTFGIIVQARMGSSRLPGKSMKLLDKNPTIYHVITQLRNCKQVKNIIVATTDSKGDDIIEEFVKKMDISCYRGNSLDVLDRFYKCAKKYSLSHIIRITADNPLIDPNLVDNAITEYEKNDFDYVTNCLKRTFPHGTEVEIFSFKSLEKSWLNAKKQYEREHVTPYIYNNPKSFKILNIENKKNLSHLRWTLDTEEDLILIKKIINNIQTRPIILNDILNFLNQKF